MDTGENPYIVPDDHWLALHHELNWLRELLMKRDKFFREGIKSFNFDSLLDKTPVAPIDPAEYPSSAYAILLEEVFAHSLDNTLLQDFNISESMHRFIHHAERLVLLLAMAPCLCPELLDCFRVQDDLGRDIVEFGGNSTSNFKGFLPTGETAAYILAGRDLRKRALLQAIIHPKHYLFEQGILFLAPAGESEPPLSSQLVLSAKYIDILVRGQYEFLFDGTNLDKIDDDETNSSNS